MPLNFPSLWPFKNLLFGPIAKPVFIWREIGEKRGCPRGPLAAVEAHVKRAH